MHMLIGYQFAKRKKKGKQDRKHGTSKYLGHGNEIIRLYVVKGTH